jgi:DNA uptake protein ComE-like DNA-binding protein
MPDASSSPRGRRPGSFIISRKDRLGALLLALLVLVYLLLSMPQGSLKTYHARVDSMPKKSDRSSYISNYNELETVPKKNPWPNQRADKNRPQTTPQQGAFVFENETYPSARNSTKRWATLLLNQADSATLEALPGIGPVLASRIVRYREKLGGFYNKSQLREVYGISDSLYLMLETRVGIIADSSKVKKIDLNQVSEEVLRQHPYLRWEKAKSIVRYREANGPFREVNDLQKIIALDSVTRQRILPYLHWSGTDLY